MSNLTRIKFTEGLNELLQLDEEIGMASQSEEEMPHVQGATDHHAYRSYANVYQSMTQESMP